MSVCLGSAPPFPVGLGRLLCDPPEDCRSDGGSSSGGGSSSAGEPGGTESNSSTRTPERETLEPGDAEDPGGHLAAKQRPVARSKIKVRSRLCRGRHLHHALASGSRGQRPSLPRPPAHPAPVHSARPPRGSCTCPWAAARASPRALRSAGGASCLRRCAPKASAPSGHSPSAACGTTLKGSGSASFLPFGAQGPENSQVVGVPVVGEEGPRHRNSNLWGAVPSAL